MLWSIASAVARLVTMARTVRRPPQWHVQTSMPNVRCNAVAQARRGRIGLGPDGGGGAGGCGASMTVGRRLALGANTPWKQVRWSPRGGSSATRPSLRLPPVAPILQASEALLGHRPARTVAAEPTQPFPVERVHRRVRVQREAVGHRQPARLLLRGHLFSEGEPVLRGFRL